MKTTNVAPAYVFKKLLLTLETMRSCAEKGPTPDPELVAIHGELAVINANFALLKGMAEHAIETIERLAGHTLDDAKAWMEPKFKKRDEKGKPSVGIQSSASGRSG